MKFRLVSTLLIATALLFGATACDRAGKRDASGGDGGAAVGGSSSQFLRTRNARLNSWLDEAFEVDYRHMTSQLIFDQVPLNDIRYELVTLPAAAPPFNFSHPSITRRELLRAISQHWNLKMSLVTTQGGEPVAVRVEG